ncbi:hypothetical protein [Streptomyces griseosporeus]|uniref:hypothetical protein n=1 Tax=Streptomyces griseosporeus TaxID=1910 RepID=UPI00167DFC41|nr:hypothetical protein [Streptomyces griseosporeus]GHF52879.1 hypothetical protein GCM10018783_22130 [Streptomyces griseosporeus]
MLRKFGKLAAVAAVATAAVSLASAPASAASTAYNTRTVWVDGIPRETDADACTTRTLYLSSGTYTWTQILNNSRYPSRDIYLAAGTYTWTDCIRPHDYSYQQTSTLDKAGSSPATLNDPSFQLDAGDVTFGSLLDPHF